MNFLEKKLLIDSNSYFRLAKSIHPLLHNTFGKEFYYTIYILKECDQEYSKSQGLQNKFRWVNQKEYSDNRKKSFLDCTLYDDAICNNIRFIKIHAAEQYLNVSEVDIKYLATALELECILVTDDNYMINIANEFEIQVMSSLELLKLMLVTNKIDINKVKEITDYWLYTKDTPKKFKQDCKRIFNIEYS